MTFRLKGCFRELLWIHCCTPVSRLELQLEELESAATEDAIRAEQAVGQTTKVAGFDRRHPVKKSFPAHLPRERVVIEALLPAPAAGRPRS